MFPSTGDTPFVRFADKFFYQVQNVTEGVGCDCRLFLILEGKTALRIGGERHELDRFDLCYIPPALPYAFEPGEKFKLIAINFDFSQKAAHLTATQPRVSPKAFRTASVTDLPPKEFSAPFVLHHMESMQETFESIIREKFFSDDCAQRMTALLLESCLIRLYRLLKTPSSASEQQLMQKIMLFLTENATDKQCETKLAATLSYHPYYLNRVFKRCTGQTIHSYIMRERVRLAADLLLSDSAKCEEIAERVGMPNHAHFTKTFRRYMGVTPATYRKSAPL